MFEIMLDAVAFPLIPCTCKNCFCEKYTSCVFLHLLYIQRHELALLCTLFPGNITFSVLQTYLEISEEKNIK